MEKAAFCTNSAMDNIRSICEPKSVGGKLHLNVLGLFCRQSIFNSYV